MFVCNESDKKVCFSHCLRWRALDFFFHKGQLRSGSCLIFLYCAPKRGNYMQTVEKYFGVVSILMEGQPECGHTRTGSDPSGAKEAGEKLVISVESGEKARPRLKPVHSAGSMRGLKPPPPSDGRFSAGCKAHVDFAGFVPGINPRTTG
jgi:hypothetical protein